MFSSKKSKMLSKGSIGAILLSAVTLSEAKTLSLPIQVIQSNTSTTSFNGKRSGISQTDDIFQAFSLVTFTLAGQTVSSIVDTGSSILWVGDSDSTNSYVQDDLCTTGSCISLTDSSAVDIGTTDSITYAQGNTVTLEFYESTLGIAGVDVSDFQFGFTSENPGIDHSIFGFRKMVGTSESATIVDMLKDQDFIDSASFSITYEGPLTISSNEAIAEGNILFGGYDSSKLSGDMAVFDMDDNCEFPDLTSVALKSSSGSSSLASVDVSLNTVLDSGSTNAITIPGMSSITDLIEMTDGMWVCADYDDYVVEMTFGNYTLAIPLNNLAGRIGTDYDMCNAFFSDSDIGAAVLGQFFMTNIVSYWDFDTNVVGIAPASDYCSWASDATSTTTTTSSDKSTSESLNTYAQTATSSSSSSIISSKSVSSSTEALTSSTVTSTSSTVKSTSSTVTSTSSTVTSTSSTVTSTSSTVTSTSSTVTSTSSTVKSISSTVISSSSSVTSTSSFITPSSSSSSSVTSTSSSITPASSSSSSVTSTSSSITPASSSSSSVTSTSSSITPASSSSSSVTSTSSSITPASSSSSSVTSTSSSITPASSSSSSVTSTSSSITPASLSTSSEFGLSFSTGFISSLTTIETSSTGLFSDFTSEKSSASSGIGAISVTSNLTFGSGTTSAIWSTKIGPYYTNSSFSEIYSDSTSYLLTTSTFDSSSFTSSQVISSVETTPVTSSVETTPVTSSVETTPVTSSVETTPAISSVETTPVTSSIETTPVTSSVETTPVTSSVETTPVTSSIETTLVTSSSTSSTFSSSIETGIVPTSAGKFDFAENKIENGHASFSFTLGDLNASEIVVVASANSGNSFEPSSLVITEKNGKIVASSTDSSTTAQLYAEYNNIETDSIDISFISDLDSAVTSIEQAVSLYIPTGSFKRDTTYLKIVLILEAGNTGKSSSVSSISIVSSIEVSQPVTTFSSSSSSANSTSIPTAINTSSDVGTSKVTTTLSSKTYFSGSTESNKVLSQAINVLTGSFTYNATATLSEELTTLITTTSCNSNACSLVSSTALVSVATKTVSGTITEFTTYCPLSADKTASSLITTESLLSSGSKLTTTLSNGQITSANTLSSDQVTSETTSSSESTTSVILETVSFAGIQTSTSTNGTTAVLSSTYTGGADYLKTISATLIGFIALLFM
ncbi:hypothetical protein QEN19_001042 [Hanseniaspora menglaensis]